MYSRKMYSAAVTATANGIATLTVPTRGRILAVSFALSINSITDNSEVIVELSRASATEINVNGAQQCIAEIRCFVNFVTSGLWGNPFNVFVPVSVPVDQGQIIYLHTVIAGTLALSGGALIWLE